jgi:hypothetical protein
VLGRGSSRASPIGLVALVLNNGFVIELKNILYVPSIKRNLVYVTLLDNDGYSYNFGDLVMGNV